MLYNAATSIAVIMRSSPSESAGATPNFTISGQSDRRRSRLRMVAGRLAPVSTAISEADLNGCPQPALGRHRRQVGTARIGQLLAGDGECQLVAGLEGELCIQRHIGRGSCRERVGQAVESSVVAV